jgi:hypothetical protein
LHILLLLLLLVLLLLLLFVLLLLMLLLLLIVLLMLYPRCTPLHLPHLNRKRRCNVCITGVSSSPILVSHPHLPSLSPILVGFPCHAQLG